MTNQVEEDLHIVAAGSLKHGEITWTSDSTILEVLATKTGPQLVTVYNDLVKRGRLLGMTDLIAVERFKDKASALSRIDALGTKLATAFGDKKPDQDMPGIPDFLLVKNRQPLTTEQQERLKTINGSVHAANKLNYNRPRSWTPEAEALLKQQEIEKSQHKVARINALRRSKGQEPIKESKPRKARTPGNNGISKTQLIAGLLTRSGGCTTKDILEATGWPSVSVPAMAKAAKLVLVKTKVDGVTRYSA